MDSGSSSFDQASTPLSRQHTSPPYSIIGFHWQRGHNVQYCSPLRKYSRLLGHMTPLWRQMKRPGIMPPEQSACEYHCDRCLTFKAKRSVLRKNGTDAFSTKDA